MDSDELIKLCLINSRTARGGVAFFYDMPITELLHWAQVSDEINQSISDALEGDL